MHIIHNPRALYCAQCSGGSGDTPFFVTIKTTMAGLHGVVRPAGPVKPLPQIPEIHRPIIIGPKP